MGNDGKVPGVRSRFPRRGRYQADVEPPPRPEVYTAATHSMPEPRYPREKSGWQDPPHPTGSEIALLRDLYRAGLSG